MTAIDVGTTPVALRTADSGVLNIYNEGPSVVYLDMTKDITAEQAMIVIEVGDTYINSNGWTGGTERWAVCKTGTAHVRWGMER